MTTAEGFMVLDLHMTQLLLKETEETTSLDQLIEFYCCVSAVINTVIDTTQWDNKYQKMLDTQLIPKLKPNFLNTFLTTREQMYKQLFPNIVEIVEEMTNV